MFSKLIYYGIKIHPNFMLNTQKRHCLHCKTTNSCSDMNLSQTHPTQILIQKKNHESTLPCLSKIEHWSGVKNGPFMQKNLTPCFRNYKNKLDCEKNKKKTKS